MAPPFLDPAACRDELHSLAARAGVSVEYLCATAQSATQFARDSVNAHKAKSNQNLPYPTYDDLETVVRGLWDDDFGNDDFDFEIKQSPWNESEHPRDDQGRFTSGGRAGLAQASISLHEVIRPRPYVPPTRTLTAQQARDELIYHGKRLASVRSRMEVKLIKARKLLAHLDQQTTSDDAERAAWNNQRISVGEQVEHLRRRLAESEREDVAKLRELLYVVDPTPLNVRFDVRPNYSTIVVPIVDQRRKDAAHSGAEEMRRLVSAKLTVGDMFFEQENNGKSRSRHLPNKRVKLTEDAGTRIVVHEFGHEIEHANPSVKQKAIAFRASRTQGEVPLPLSQLDKDKGYGPEEKALKDRFIDPYMGKVYLGDRDTEIITMGLEFFYSDPVRLATEDPEYFDFIYNTLRGQ